FGFGDLHGHIVGAAMDIVPGEGPGELSFELVTEGHRVVAIAENEVLADAKAGESSEDEPVLDGAGSFPHVQHAVGREFRNRGRHLIYLFWFVLRGVAADVSRR